jgi:hypothetical protein
MSTPDSPLPIARRGTSFWVPGLLWLITYFGARAGLEATSLPAALRIAFAILPLPFFVWFLVSFVQAQRHSDELERRIQLEALAVAFPLTMVLVMTLGLLELAIHLPPQDWSYRHVWAFLPVFYLVGLALARKRYA